MAYLIANDVSFELPNGRLLFQHLSVSFESRVTALVGPNGVGKTCFAKILAHDLDPTDGRIVRRGEVHYFAQREDAPNLTVAEYLEGHWSPLIESVSLEASCSSLSGGQWMRVRLTQILSREADFLILDEPTNDLDQSGRRAVREFIRSFAGGVLLISHDRELLTLCDDVVEFSNRGVARFGLGWSDYVAEKNREREGLARDLDHAKRERDQSAQDRATLVARQAKRNRQGDKAGKSGSLPKILVGGRKRRAQATTGRVNSETLERAEAAVSASYEAYQELKVDPVMYAELTAREIAANALIAQAEGFNVAYDQERFVFARDLDFAWRGAMRLAIRGANGSGKSTLIRALMGDTFAVTRGQLSRGQLPVLYVDQRGSILDESLTILENLSDSQLDETEKRNGLAKFLFTGERVFMKVRDLSGGERLRAALAKGFLSGVAPSLLILDEPTNNLDLVNVEFLENLLRQFTGALIVVSHDEVFIENCGITSYFELSEPRN